MYYTGWQKYSGRRQTDRQTSKQTYKQQTNKQTNKQTKQTNKFARMLIGNFQNNPCKIPELYKGERDSVRLLNTRTYVLSPPPLTGKNGEHDYTRLVTNIFYSFFPAGRRGGDVSTQAYASVN